MPEIQIGSRVRKSPYFEATTAAGATAFTVYNAMYMPTSYGDPDAEYRRLTEGVAIWDVGVERQVEIAGPDAAALTEYLTARELAPMKVGRARYAPMCDHAGRLLNDPVALRLEQDRYWLSLADNDMLLWVRAIAGERQSDVEVFEPDVAPLAIQGPLADDLAEDLFGADVVDNLGFFHHRAIELQGIPLVLCRSGWSKQGGFELFLTDSSRGIELWDLIIEAGQPYGIGPGSPNHQERMENGLLSFGSDHDRETDPIEAGLGQYVSLDTHWFLGKQALLRRLERTDRRPVVNVRLRGDFIACDQPWPASIEGQPVGEIRSATWSPRLETWIGLGQFVMPHHEPGTIVDIQIADHPGVTAIVTDEPFGTVQTVREL